MEFDKSKLSNPIEHKKAGEVISIQNLKDTNENVNLNVKLRNNELPDKEEVIKISKIEFEKPELLRKNKELEEIKKTLNDPNDLDELYNTGMSYYDQKKYVDACKYFERVLEINPKHENSLYKNGMSY